MTSPEFVSNTIAALEEIRTELGKLGQSDAKIDELKQYIDARLSSAVPGVPPPIGNQAQENRYEKSQVGGLEWGPNN